MCDNLNHFCDFIFCLTESSKSLFVLSNKFPQCNCPLSFYLLFGYKWHAAQLQIHCNWGIHTNTKKHIRRGKKNNQIYGALEIYTSFHMLYFNRTKAIKRHNFNSSLYLLQTSFSIYVIYLSKIMGFFGHYKCYTRMKQLNSSEKKK